MTRCYSARALGRCKYLGVKNPLASSQISFPSHLLDSDHPPYQLATLEHAQRIMEGAEKGDKASPLQIDPKWYVRRATYVGCVADR